MENERKKPLVDLDECQILEVINGIDLREPQKVYLRSRWMKQVMWWEKRARDDKGWYFGLSLIALISSAITTAISGINLAGNVTNIKFPLPVYSFNPFPSVDVNSFSIPISALVLFFSLIVTISTGWERLYKHNEVYLRKRQHAELLKIEFWRFLQQIDRCRCENRDEAFSVFVDRVEDLIDKEIGGYVQLYKNKTEIDDKNK